jgi:hypothetical protein
VGGVDALSGVKEKSEPAIWTARRRSQLLYLEYRRRHRASFNPRRSASGSKSSNRASSPLRVHPQSIHPYYRVSNAPHPTHRSPSAPQRLVGMHSYRACTYSAPTLIRAPENTFGAQCTRSASYLTRRSERVPSSLSLSAPVHHKHTGRAPTVTVPVVFELRPKRMPHHRPRVPNAQRTNR